MADVLAAGIESRRYPAATVAMEFAFIIEQLVSELASADGVTEEQCWAHRAEAWVWADEMPRPDDDQGKREIL